MIKLPSHPVNKFLLMIAVAYLSAEVGGFLFIRIDFDSNPFSALLRWGVAAQIIAPVCGALALINYIHGGPAPQETASWIYGITLMLFPCLILLYNVTNRKAYLYSAYVVVMLFHLSFGRAYQAALEEFDKHPIVMN